MTVSVAPMMDWTDSHCRVFHRLLSPHARLYTEMVHAQAVVHGDRDRLLGFSEVEHPVAVQLGGSEPAGLAHFPQERPMTGSSSGWTAPPPSCMRERHEVKFV